MNIIEAIKSGKPFSRTDWAPKFYTLDDESQPMILPREAIDDKWIIQEKTITITESQLEEVLREALVKIGSSSSIFFDHIKKELGF